MILLDGRGFRSNIIGKQMTGGLGKTCSYIDLSEWTQSGRTNESHGNDFFSREEA